VEFPSSPDRNRAAGLIADDDEAFTYNKRVNRLATVQEHYMIVKALERGVSKRSSPGLSTSTSS